MLLTPTMEDVTGDDTGKTPFEFDKNPGWNLNRPTIRVLKSSV